MSIDSATRFVHVVFSGLRFEFRSAAALFVTISWLFASVAIGQQPVEYWPPQDYFGERIAALPANVPSRQVPEEIPAESSSVLNPAMPSEPLPSPATVSPDVETGPFWYPDSLPVWVLDPAWDAGLEVGINATEGNAQAFSSRIGANLSRKSDLWEFKSNLIYAKSTANGSETQHNAIFNTGYERQFADTRWSHFGKLSLEYDEFKAFDLRLAPNIGFGYQFLMTDLTTLKGRFGAGVSHEINSPDDRWVPEAVFGADFNHQISKRQKLTFTADYFPEWTDFANYRLVTDMAWHLAIDDASKLNLKLAVNDRYDSTPNGRKPNDVIYALLLLWTL